MKIENIKVNSFGKLKNKEINLSNGINLIYGKNEAGKSTLLKFIENIFYGTSRNKKGKNFSDYDLYKPWNDEEFSGKIIYKLDSGEKYEVYREFGKKNPKIYNEQLEDISKQFNINKNTGNEFFYEQTKVDEFMFTSSVVSMQQEVKLNSVDQNVYIQKIANLASTGDDTVSFKKAMDKLNKKQLEEIGTDRTQGKPINVVKNKIDLYENKIQELSKYKQNKYEIEEKENILEKEIENSKIKSKCIRELQEIKQAEKLEIEKLNLSEKIKEKNEEQINSMQKEIDELLEEKEKNEKQTNTIGKLNYKVYLIFIIICIVVGIVSVSILKNIFIGIAASIIAVIIALFYVSKSRKIKKQELQEKNRKNKIDNDLDEKVKIIKNKIDLIKKNNDEIDEEINKLTKRIDIEIDLKKEQLKTKYLYQIKYEELNRLLDSDVLSNELEKSEAILHEEELRLNMIHLEKRQATENLEDLISIDEELETAKQEYEELLEKNDKINKARELMQKAYEKMKNSVTPKFTSNLSNNIDKISNGKYNKVWVNDIDGMIVGLENGEYVSAEKLSTGTIEQLYLALRLSMAKEISEEAMPIILDEAFAYYDDERLENTLKFLAENFKDNQIILFTCTHREEKALKNINKEYQLIELDSLKI